MSAADPSNVQVIGEWTLRSARYEFQDGGDAFDIYGPRPNGRLIITAAGRFTAIITAGPPDATADAQGAGATPSAMAYSGTYTLSGDTFVTRVDVAWFPGWVGTDQERSFVVEGDDLTLFTPIQGHPAYPGRLGRGELRWTRAS
jgi:hypothetical protein